MNKAAQRNPLRHLRASDIRGAVRLAAQATHSVSRIVEGVHQSVWDRFGVRGSIPGQTGGVTGFVYNSIRGLTHALGVGVEASLLLLEKALDSPETANAVSPQREAVLAALNGVMGDRLLADDNPLAIGMTLRCRGTALDWSALPIIRNIPEPNGKLLLMIHGLCRNDLQWDSQHEGKTVNHGERLAAELGLTPIYLRYNTGLHVSQNGRELAQQLEQLLRHWPLPLEEISVLAHSMGGLVIRSAAHYARTDGLAWPERLKNIVFLGTPHHGAPLERAGNIVDVLLGSTPFTVPLARLGQLRSPGITDLRFGCVVDEDWYGYDRFHRKPDSRRRVPLPEGVACYAVAATTAAKRSLLADRLIGDGLVPLHSALGHHRDRRRRLDFPKSSQWIAYQTSHMALLNRPEVSAQMLRWLRPGSPAY
ncbi:MAG: hypothetical protein QM739_12780 [Propionivibrio sp.]